MSPPSPEDIREEEARREPTAAALDHEAALLGALHARDHESADQVLEKIGEAWGYALARAVVRYEVFMAGVVRGMNRAARERPEILPDGTLDPELPSEHSTVAESDPGPSGGREYLDTD